MNCTFLDFEPFCRAALSQIRQSAGIGPLCAGELRQTFETVFPEIDRAVCAVRPELSQESAQRRATLALYGIISVACDDSVTDSEIEELVSGLFVSRQLAVA